MLAFKDSEMLTRLATALDDKRDRLAKLLRSISGVGHSENMKPSVFRRFMQTLEHIADIKEDETKILNQIDAIEAEHRNNRKRQALRRGDMAPEPKPEPVIAPLPEPKRADNDFWWLLALWYLLTPKKNNDK